MDLMISQPIRKIQCGVIYKSRLILTMSYLLLHRKMHLISYLTI